MYTVIIDEAVHGGYYHVRESPKVNLSYPKSTQKKESNMPNLKVKPLYSPRTDKPVKNQHVIHVGDSTRIFQSYDTIIARYDDGKLTLDENAMGYSKTTSKYLYQFTNSNKEQLEARIKAGVVTVRDLNKCL